MLFLSSLSLSSFNSYSNELYGIATVFVAHGNHENQQELTTDTLSVLYPLYCAQLLRAEDSFSIAICHKNTNHGKGKRESECSFMQCLAVSTTFAQALN